MSHAMPAEIVDPARKPAAWLVATGILSAVLVSASCLTILIR